MVIYLNQSSIELIMNQIFSCTHSAAIGYVACMWLEKVYLHYGNRGWYYGNLSDELQDRRSFDRCRLAEYIVGENVKGESAKRWKVNATRLLK